MIFNWIDSNLLTYNNSIPANQLKYRKYKVEKHLSPFIECYYHWEGFTADLITVETPPNAYCSLVVNYENPYLISTHKYSKTEVAQAFISGQAIRNYTLHLKGKIGMVGVVLKPATLFHFLGIPMYEFTEERVPLDKIFPDKANEIIAKIKEAIQPLEKVKVLKELANELYKNRNFGTEQIRYAANAILDQKGVINITTLMEELYMSRRKFERKFLEEVGVSPKTYAKIRRFGYTCSLMAGKRKVNLTETLYRGGYYDQSHFIKDFKYFAGRTPKFYVENNQELANFIESRVVIE